MSHSYASCLYHCVWSTKQRQRIIIPELRERLWPYIGGIAKQNRMKALAIGGVEDHVHLLLSLPSSVSVSKSLQLIKGGSSKWVHDTFPEQRHFAWQASNMIRGTSGTNDAPRQSSLTGLTYRIRGLATQR